ncbi:MAG TPA: RHS repeat-associated core domain-containing protein [Candidatus Saccharimonadales bacterium]|nr:RHS repeat-associated core domain-containing protein [Candidatus Saccharimonadales bacterium]
MGTRIYLPTLGLFTSMDPVPGGNANAYVYALDPINFSDLSGDCILQCTADISYFQPAAGTGAVQSAGGTPAVPSVSTNRIATVYAAVIVTQSVPSVTRVRTATVVSPGGALASPTVSAGWFAQRAAEARPHATASAESFNYSDAASTAVDWYFGGMLAGGIIGCMFGGAAGALAGAAAAGIGAIPGAAVGCVEGGEAGSMYGGALGAAVGFELGGNGNSHADAFEWGADQTEPWPWE